MEQRSYSKNDWPAGRAGVEPKESLRDWEASLKTTFNMMTDKNLSDLMDFNLVIPHYYHGKGVFETATMLVQMFLITGKLQPSDIGLI